MRIAIPSPDGRKVGGHAGQARQWLLFEAEAGAAPALVEHIELAADQVFHHFRGRGPHPLDGIGALITRNAGEGFLNRMRKMGVDTALTSETDPARAARDYLAGTLAPPRADRLLRLLCKLRDMFSEHR